MFMILLLVVIVFLAIYIYRRVQYQNSDYYHQTKNPYRTTILNKGIQGEFNIATLLEPFLSQSARILYNVYIPTKNGETTEIDIILISHSGLFVIESKNYSGWIFGDVNRKKWCQTLPARRGCEKHYFYNPVWQNRAHIRHLQGLLGSTLPYYSIVVFSDKCTFKKLSMEDASASVIYAYHLQYVIQRIQAIEGVRLDEAQIDHIYTSLCPYTHADDYIKAKHRNDVFKKQH